MHQLELGDQRWISMVLDQGEQYIKSDKGAFVSIRSLSVKQIPSNCWNTLIAVKKKKTKKNHTLPGG